MPDRFTDDLSAYLDSELDEPRRRQVEVHLAECAECARMLADLRAITDAAPRYEGRAPSRDLWPEIATQLDRPRVLTLRPRSRPGRRFGWRELVAASILMAAVGGGASWLALRSRGAGPTQVPPVPTLSAATAPGLTPAAYADAQYDAAVRDLERELDAGRNRLDSATVRVIEQSLRTIDDAIAEARAAIQRDPANAYLTRQVAANMRRKLNLLRAATNAIAAQS